MQYPYDANQLASELGMKYKNFKAWRWSLVQMGALPDHKGDGRYCTGTTVSRRFSEKYLSILKEARAKAPRRRSASAKASVSSIVDQFIDKTAVRAEIANLKNQLRELENLL